MHTRIDRWGDDLAVRIPPALARQAQLEDGTAVGLSIPDGRLVITPI